MGALLYFPHMVTRYERNGITWIDMETPSREELRSIVEEFNIDARIEEEIISETPYPLVVEATEYIYLVLHFPTTDPRGGAKSQEIDFIIGKNFVVTCRYEVITTIHNLHKVFESEELLGLESRKNEKPTAADLIERILRQMYASISEEAEQFARMLDRIEADIFAGKERETVLNISLVGRILLRFDTTLSRHEEPLHAFLTELASARFFGKGFAEHIVHIEAEHQHAASVVSSYRAVANELRNTNDSLLSTAQNDIIKRLTIMTFAAFPLTVITGLFGMNTDTIPFITSDHAFWIILLIMAISLTAFLSYFRIRRWW